MALNSLFISAELSRLDANASTTNVEVLNYSQIAQDPRTQASQAGVALQTASDVHVTLQNFYDLTRGLVEVAYEPACVGPPLAGRRPAGCTFANKPGVDNAARDAALRDYLRTFRPRVNAIVDFFTNDRNAMVLSLVGAEVFSLDMRSLRGMAVKLRQDVSTFVDEGAAAATAAARYLHTALQQIGTIDRFASPPPASPTTSSLAGGPSSFPGCSGCWRRGRSTCGGTRQATAKRYGSRCRRGPRAARGRAASRATSASPCAS